MSMSRIWRGMERRWIIVLPLIIGPATAVAQTTLSVVPGSAIAGGTGSLSISIASTSGYAPAALEWTFVYSASTFGDITLEAGAAAAADGKTVACAYSTGSVRCIAWGLNNKTISNGVAATVSFAVSPQAAATSTVQLTGLVATTPKATPIAATGIGTTLTIASPNHISGLTCSPASLVTPASATCTLKFAAAASSSVVVAVGLNPNVAAVTIPSAVIVAAGTTSANFPLEADAVSAFTKAVIVATIGASSASVSVPLAP